MIYFRKKKKDTVGHKQIPRNTLLGHMIYFRGEKRHCWAQTDSKKYIAGAHVIFQKEKKDTVGHVIDSQNTLLGNIILFLIYC